MTHPMKNGVVDRFSRLLAVPLANLTEFTVGDRFARFEVEDNGVQQGCAYGAGVWRAEDCFRALTLLLMDGPFGADESGWLDGL